MTTPQLHPADASAPYDLLAIPGMRALQALIYGIGYSQISIYPTATGICASITTGGAKSPTITAICIRAGSDLRLAELHLRVHPSIDKAIRAHYKGSDVAVYTRPNAPAKESTRPPDLSPSTISHILAIMSTPEYTSGQVCALEHQLPCRAAYHDGVIDATYSMPNQQEITVKYTITGSSDKV